MSDDPNPHVCAPPPIPWDTPSLPLSLRNQFSYSTLTGSPPPPTHTSWTPQEIQSAHAQWSKYTFSPVELAELGVASDVLDLLNPLSEFFGQSWLWTNKNYGSKEEWPSVMVLSCHINEGQVRGVYLVDMWTQEVVYKAHEQNEDSIIRANLARLITAETYLVGPDVCAALSILRIAHSRVVRMPDSATIMHLNHEMSILSSVDTHGHTYQPFGGPCNGLEEEVTEWTRVLNTLMWFDATFESELVH